MLDLRIPIGSLFIIMGTMIVVYGYFFPSQTPYGNVSVDLNLAWGSIMGMFGVIMLLIAFADKQVS